MMTLGHFVTHKKILSMSGIGFCFTLAFLQKQKQVIVFSFILKWMYKDLASLIFIFEWVSDYIKIFMHAKSRINVNLEINFKYIIFLYIYVN
jgi:hypothetical protein